MKSNGFYLVKICKTVNLYLWSKDRSDLEDVFENGMQIVPAFKDGSKEYIEVDSKLLRIA